MLEATLTADEKIALMRSIFAAFAGSGDVTRLIDSLTDDAVYRVTVDPGTPLSGEFRGKEGAARYFAGMPAAVEHLELRVDDFFASGERTVVTGYEKLRICATGEVCSSDWAVVCTFRGAKIQEVVVIENLAALTRAFPAPSAA